MNYCVLDQRFVIYTYVQSYVIYLSIYEINSLIWL